jgi:ABC-type nitrate/sulfonate/bicarbonate transport system ATPase subunit
MLDVRGLRKVYEGRERQVEAVRDLTFTLDAGDLVCLVGPSGCGKTTLLKCMSGLLAPTSGEVRLRDQVITGPPPGMAVVFQEYGRSLFPWMSVRDNGPSVAAWSTRRSPPSASATPTAPIRGSSPAACSSGWPSPARLRTSRMCC